jgi:hypothetical protein
VRGVSRGHGWFLRCGSWCPLQQCGPAGHLKTPDRSSCAPYPGTGPDAMPSWSRPANPGRTAVATSASAAVVRPRSHLCWATGGSQRSRAGWSLPSSRAVSARRRPGSAVNDLTGLLAATPVAFDHHSRRRTTRPDALPAGRHGLTARRVCP